MVPNTTRLNIVIRDGFMDKVTPIEDKYLKNKRMDTYYITSKLTWSLFVIHPRVVNVWTAPIVPETRCSIFIYRLLNLISCRCLQCLLHFARVL
jgi:hypothetical protein